MANNTLVYKFDELEDCSKKIESVASALSDLKKLSDDIKNGVYGYWQGSAYSKFISRFTSMNEAMEKLYQEVKASKEKLDTAINLERQNEESLTQNTVGRLSADNIF